MADTAFFLRKRKDKERRPRVASAAASASASASARAGPSGTTNAPSPAGSSSSRPSQPSSARQSSQSAAQVKSEPEPGAASASTSNGANPNVTEIKIFSSAPGSGLRFNMMKLNHRRDVDPAQLNKPILMNRKRPGPRQPPMFAVDTEGKIVGRYVYDNEGKPVLDAEGQPVVERRAEGADMSLVGQAPDGTGGNRGAKRKMKKGTKEVFHQDIEIMRLRREEAQPWVLESGNPSQGNNQGNPLDHWVGKMQEPSALPTVLLINDGTTEGFEMVPLGRTYRFDPDRPFNPPDSDSANKMWEHQAKHKLHDRWALRPDGPSHVVSTESVVNSMKAERNMEDRAAKFERGIRVTKGMTLDVKPKVERFEDDYKREGRKAERGLEGGVDEELDFDEAEEFQDDDDVNTFYRNVEEEDEAREAEEQQKKEYRLANANVGDKPQIASDDDEDDLFGERKALDDEGKKLKRIIRKRKEDGLEEGDYSDEDESDESDAESVDSKAAAEKNKEKEKDKDKDGKASLVADRPSRPASRGPGGRSTHSPSGRRGTGPLPGKASTAPPGSGAALLAQRAASRGASPRPPGGGRAGSPLSGRATSPDAPGGSGRAASPPMRGSSPVSVRGASPAPGAARGSSPVSGPPTRAASPGPAGASSSKPKSGKRKTTSESPGPSASASASGSGSGSQSQSQSAQPSPSGKRKNSPAPGPSEPRPGKKSKKGSSTPTPGPEEIPSFPGMITKQDVLDWFRQNNKDVIPMSEAIAAFRGRIMNAGKNREANQKLFLTWMKMLADQEEKMLRLKPEYR